MTSIFIFRYKSSQNESKSSDTLLIDSKDRFTSSAKGWSSTDSELRRSASSSEEKSKKETVVDNSMEAQKKFGSAKAISSDQFFKDSRDNDVSKINVTYKV